MKHSFSPSVNILRDNSSDFYYVPTSNSKEIYSQIASLFKSGVHSFNIVGSYGTGKSAFLVALNQHLNKEQEYFAPVNGQFNGCSQFMFIKVIGEADSFIKLFSEQLGVEAEPKTILKALNTLHTDLQKNGQCLVIAIDEFGKFLEYAVKHNPDKELYFIQQLAEFANKKEHNVLFLSTLHQNFDAYAAGLSKSQRQEWEKVKGRLKELAFNEPVEQLLHLVTEYVQSQFGEDKSIYSKQLTASIKKSGAFSLLNDTNQSFVQSLYPFDLLSAMILTKALQTYGQNERSLFHFLSTDEKYGLYDYDKQNNPYFNLNCVYDYLTYNYYGVLTSRYNPSYFQWTLLRNSLDRIEVELTEFIPEAQKLVKTIGLLNILGSPVAKLNDDLLFTYAETALGISNPKNILDLLLKKKILRYQKFNDRYKLFQGTDIDIDQLIEDKKIEVEAVTDIIAELRGIFKLNIIQAKAITYENGTPRFFKFVISSEPITTYKEDDGAIDGYINLVFRDKVPTKAIKSVEDEPILYGIFQKTEIIKDLLHDVKVTEEALKSVSEDNVARQELEERKSYHVKALNDAINEELFDSEESIKWYFNGHLLKINNRRTFNQQLSEICRVIYPNVPNFQNELMNKEKPSSSIHTAKRYYFEHLLENFNKIELGFPTDKNPAEKTIYKTLLANTGIHIDNGVYAQFTENPSDKSFQALWDTSKLFLESAKIGKRSVIELVNTLKQKPFKLKDGFIEFWVGTFLFIHREEYALFKDTYIPKFHKEVFDLIYKEAHKYYIKTFNVEGVRLELFNKYRALTQVAEEEKITNSSFKETATPFLMFYKQLPSYVQQSKRLSKETLTFRDVIANATELEKTFFEDLPAAFGLSLNNLTDSESKLANFVEQIEDCIRELRMALGELTNRIEEGLLQILGTKETDFEKYTSQVRKRYEHIKTHLLLPNQKKFHTRLNSQIPNREDWLNNVVHGLLGKKLEDISDLDEVRIFDKLKDAFQELDNLVEISKTDFEAEDDVISIKLSGLQKQAVTKNIIISAKQQKEVSALEKSIDKLLSKDDKINQAVLAKLLQKYLNND